MAGPSLCRGNPAPDAPNETGGSVGTPAFTWAESVASHGIGPTATVDIDVHAPGHDEPVPVEIPLAKARELYAHLGGVLAEHGATPRTARLRERLERAYTEGFKLARQITDLRCELADERTRAERAEDLLRVAHDTSNRSETERALAVQRAEQAEAALARGRAECHAIGTDVCNAAARILDALDKEPTP
jgi:hypothetical protein